MCFDELLIGCGHLRLHVYRPRRRILKTVFDAKQGLRMETVVMPGFGAFFELCTDGCSARTPTRLFGLRVLTAVEHF